MITSSGKWIASLAALCFSGLLLCTVAGFGGCNNPISSEYRDEARSAPAFSQALANPDAYAGATVVWGGMIVQTRSHVADTDIIVLETPLDANDEPGAMHVSEGRFIARNAGYLDPAVYSPGRQVTVAGTVVGHETLPFGDAKYNYPVVRVKQLHLWGPENPEPPYYSGYWPYYYDPWPYDYWPYYDYYYGPYFGSWYFYGFSPHGHGDFGDHGGFHGGGHGGGFDGGHGGGGFGGGHSGGGHGGGHR